MRRLFNGALIVSFFLVVTTFVACSDDDPIEEITETIPSQPGEDEEENENEDENDENYSTIKIRNAETEPLEGHRFSGGSCIEEYLTTVYKNASVQSL